MDKDKRPVGRPPIGDRPMTNAEHIRKHRAKYSVDKPRYYCTQCPRQLRADTTRNICRACWLRTDEGKEYLRVKKAESRSKKSNNL